MKVTTLVENTLSPGANNGLKAEHGLSLLIEAAGKRLLFDFGHTDKLVPNAGVLGVDLALVDIAVLSHGHIDHGGGLPLFLTVNDKAPVYLHELAMGDYYLKIVLPKIYVGLAKDKLTAHASRLRRVDGFTDLGAGIHLLCEYAADHPRPKGNDRLLTKRDGKFHRDPFDHELTLVVEEDDGLRVFTGCSHNGVLNMARAVKERFPGRPIKLLFGGFHLSNPITGKMVESQAEVEAVALGLQDLAIDRVVTGHCTGAGAFELLRAELGDAIEHAPTGSVIEL